MMDSLGNFIGAQFENQFASGMLITVMFTALLALMRNVPSHAWIWLKRSIITTVDVADHDAAFYWIQKWLGEHEYTKSRARLLTASTRTMPISEAPAGNESPISKAESKRPRIEVVFSPAPGTHLIKFRGHWLLLLRARREVDHSGSVSYRETFTFYTFSRDVVKELIIDAQALAFPPEDNTVAVFRGSGWAWKMVQKKLPRNIESVVLENNMAEDLVGDLKQFFSSATWYADHGVPYQRGYLLIGPPGSGKTSLVTAVASTFGRDIYIINLAAAHDDSLMSLMSDIPPHSVVLIEDLDCNFEQRRRTSESQFLTFSGFLNAIDGVAAPPGRVLFLTTNHPDKVDAAVKRPGRADRTYVLDYATHNQAYRLFLRFFPGKEKLAAAFAKQAEKQRQISMAVLQEHIITYRQDSTMAATMPIRRHNHEDLRSLQLEEPDSAVRSFSSSR